MKKLYLILALLLATVFSYAQTINFCAKAGINFSTLYLNTPNSAGNGQYIAGFNAGAIVDIGFANFLIQPGLLYSVKGQKVEVFIGDGNQQGPSVVSGTERLNYLELPVNFLYVIKEIKFAKVYVGGGPYVGYGLSVSVSADGKTTSYSFNKFQSNPDYGLNALLGAEFKNRILVDAGYGFGLGNVSDGNTLQNRVISVSVGYMIK
ncbi:MAG TPA: porin family protein [Mucilaginibacter sp.]|jgi:hypothetical protein|nr:porin family protein [Mucilaginibacter sp.]